MTHNSVEQSLEERRAKKGKSRKSKKEKGDEEK